MLKKIIETAEEAGKAILSFYETEVEVITKEDDSPLTKADLAAHHIITGALKEIDPETPVISEESGVPDYEERSGWDKFWLVDPLDGTKEFIKKNGEFTVNIALIEEGVPTLGVVYVPAKDVMYYAEKSIGSYKKVNGQPAEQIFSEPADTARELSIIVSRSHGSDALEQYLQDEGIKVKERIKSGSSLKICRVAEGDADLYPRMGPTMEWDVAAGDAVYRYSSRNKPFDSGLKYNKKDLLNPNFVIGL